MCVCNRALTYTVFVTALCFREMKHVDEVWLIGGVYGWDIQVDESRYYIFTERWGSSEPHSNLTKFDGNLKTEGFP